MKAIRVSKLGDADHLCFELNVPIPICQTGELLIKVHAAGINPIDTYMRQGAFTDLRSTLPFIPGFDGAGVVEKIGENVNNFKTGDRIFFSLLSCGAYAEFCTVPFERCWHLPDHLSFEQGAAIGIPYFTAYRSLFIKAKAQTGQTVLIHGASGAVGLAACQLAHGHKLMVFGTAGSDRGLKLIKNNGCSKVFNHRQDGYIDQIKNESVNQNGVDIIIEMLANVNLTNDLSLINKDGVVVIVGCRGSATIDPRAIMAPESKIIGQAIFQATSNEWPEIIDHVLAGLKNKSLNPVVGKVFDLKHAAQAHKEIIETTAAFGKIVLQL